mmetsp:Transcript_30735/g.34978  ORF Transcript_30735/g.34978 Transcript_30735/m.34978 type:complete len:345 (+) Transcript_30735:57-1091(+)
MANKKILRVVTLSRHGTRAPFKAYPNGPEWRYQPTQLTEKGRMEHQELGRLLRQRYIHNYDFLNRMYSPAEIYVRSTNRARTIESARNQVGGLYPGLELGDIDIEALALKEDFLMISYNPTVCPNMEPIIDAHYERCKTLLSDHKVDLKLLSELSGIDENDLDLDQVTFIGDALACEKFEMGVMNSKFPKEMAEKVIYLWHYLHVIGYFENDEICRVASCPFFFDMLNRFKAAIYRHPRLVANKLALYLGHDATMVPILKILGHFNPLNVPYPASQLIFELSQHRDGQNYVEITFNNEILHIPEMGRRDFYLLEDFEEYLKGKLYQNDDKFCDACGANFPIAMF